MTKEEQIIEIDNKIVFLKEDREKAIASGGRDMPRAYQDLIDIDELQREKYDLIHGTHTNELYHLNAKLRYNQMHFSMADVLNKKHYQVRINSIKNQIQYLEELDKQIMNDELSMTLKK